MEKRRRLPSKKKTTKLKAQYFPGSPTVKTLLSTSGDMGSISGVGIKVPSAMGCGQKLKKKKKLRKRLKKFKNIKSRLSCYHIFIFVNLHKIIYVHKNI